MLLLKLIQLLILQIPWLYSEDSISTTGVLPKFAKRGRCDMLRLFEIGKRFLLPWNPVPTSESNRSPMAIFLILLFSSIKLQIDKDIMKGVRISFEEFSLARSELISKASNKFCSYWSWRNTERGFNTVHE